MERTNPDGAQELPSSGLEQAPLHHNQKSGEKRKREGLVRKECETGNSSESEQVIIVGDTKAIEDLCFDGGEQSQRSVYSKQQAFDVQSNRNGEGSLGKEEVGEEPERAKQVLAFNDFDKLRKVSNFAVGQTWALYDTVDGMPRLYAQIRTVSASGFDVSVTWLEPDPYDEEPIQKYEKDLPVSVGRFKIGKDETIKDHRRFSHEVHCNEVTSAGKFSLYPRKGETWAIIKGRYKIKYSEINWLADANSPNKYQYAFVEIVSENAGPREHLSVGFLHKAKGFLSLFSRFTEKVVASYICCGDEYQFSHRVTSFQTTGKEAEGVPRGAYELDPAALPANIKEIDVPLHLLAEPKVSNSENNMHSQCVHFASKGRTFQTGQVWSFCSGEDYLPRYYGKIQKITFVQAFEQDPVVKLHVGRLKATPTKGVIQWIDKRMPIGCGNFRATKALEIFTDLDVFSRQISPDSSGDGNNYSIMPKTGDIWAIYRNWSNDIDVVDLQSQTYDIVEVLDDKQDYKVLLLAPDGGFKLADRAGFGSVYLAATEHWIDGADVRFTIPKAELLRFSHQVPTSKVREEIHGALQEVYEPNIEALPVNLIL
ncbi:unnamed protein product [Arabidopsis lyrata]|uniref:uncharacterized protein LOC9309980 n=1 Tax=Arabidopsis lyrata subsp. lyrata TaxID=81972 RepID=UPI000A29CC3A|nr:uncharacterized protein LOC9309980 [Arabidopsis lyrata subsp. lyrata]XP_020878003.1 uncharacterized protein LOC9309980 [Arabidopsis lyrata subsp. lyrata]CAH8271535.1 unnamed protein product [Arabidopsis lyrata]|eukprot:XP_020878002.1 uncharacterized protein LOC9309980 [Arabidopsis lyrata subsp. lyrata]